MLKKLKLTKFAAVLCLFGFVLVPAAPAWADIYSPVADMKKCNEILDNFGKTSKKLKYARLGRDCYKQVAYIFSYDIDGYMDHAAVNEIKECSKVNDNFGKTSKKLKYARSGRDCFKQVAQKLIEGRLLEHGWCNENSEGYLRNFIIVGVNRIFLFREYCKL